MADMTPDDIAAIRAQYHPDTIVFADVIALCDALEAAWAELDLAQSEETGLDEDRRFWRERAEAAEAELKYVEATNCAVTSQALEAFERADRLQAELEQAEAMLTATDTAMIEAKRQRDVALAALARVRALCDKWDPQDIRGIFNRIAVHEVRAAIAGGNQ